MCEIFNENLMENIKIGFICSNTLLTLHRYKAGLPMREVDKRRLRDAIELIDAIKKGREEINKLFEGVEKC